MNTEVFVVGGGPAGLAAAIAARQVGLTVTLADQAYAPINNACGEGIMPEGVAALRALGVEVPLEQSSPFHGIHFIDTGVVARAAFTGPPGLGVRRTVLHRLLVDRARALGVVMYWGATVTTEANEIRCNGERVSCTWVIGADGQRSRLRGRAGLGPVVIWGGRIGIRQHFVTTPVPTCVEVYWHNQGQAYVTPVSANEVCVVLIGNDPDMRMHDTWGLFPALQKRLGDGQPSDTVKGRVTVMHRVPRITRGNLALIGDAAGSIDAITGEGLSLIFRQALALGKALHRGNLALYEATHRAYARTPRRMAQILLALAHTSWLRRQALVALAARPDMFTHLLAVHNGTRPLWAMGMRPLATFVGRLLAQNL